MMVTFISMCWLLLTTLAQYTHAQPPDFCVDQKYKCGNLTLNGLSLTSHPFWGQNISRQCGSADIFELTCHHDDHTTSIRIGSQIFTVKEMDIYKQTMRLVPKHLAHDVCSPQFGDTYGVNSSTFFQYDTSVYNVTIFYNCSSSIDPRFGHFECRDHNAVFYDSAEDELLKTFPWLERCGSHVQVPVDAPYDNKGDGRHFLNQAFSAGFLVKYAYAAKPDGDQLPDALVYFTVVLGTWAISTGMACCIVFCRQGMSLIQTKFWLTEKNDQDIEAFLKNDGALAEKKYKYSQVRRMTNNFKVKLGEGGFGVVYKGELLISGCVVAVAVKKLNASKGNDKEFINEVASITRTSHINVVTLLGFCLEGCKKTLIYEFMSNGSLDNYIYNNKLQTAISLSWDNLWEIAIGIAKGLEYLHKGCNIQILHFDIKPHNILLDEKFCPKISDFGLAKLCPKRESIISISNARGTIGYVAPEVSNKHFGGISYKSDVYSYGMMLVDP